LTPRRANLITVGLLLLLFALMAVTAPRWAHLLRREVPDAAGGSPSAPAAAAEEEAARVERRINVKLFLQAPDRTGLAIEERAVTFSSDLAGQVRAVVEELIQGSKSGLQPTLAPQTRVLEVFVSPRGVAYVDLSKEAQGLSEGGSEAELITVYSIVNSLTANFPAIKRVQILVEDKPATTLAGHVDLTHPLPPDMTLLAAAPVHPVGGSR
jgi:hypothetical protein